jgi:hypothetical protein
VSYGASVLDDQESIQVCKPSARTSAGVNIKAIVNRLGPIRQIVQNDRTNIRRYLVITEGKLGQPGKVVQWQR